MILLPGRNVQPSTKVEPNMLAQRYMLSPCGRFADFFNTGECPDGWTDCTEMSDEKVGEIMMRRLMAAL